MMFLAGRSVLAVSVLGWLLFASGHPQDPPPRVQAVQPEARQELGSLQPPEIELIHGDEDAQVADTLRTYVDQGVDRIHAFFELPFRRPFTMRIFPGRAEFDAFFREQWKIPETQCWWVAAGLESGLVLLSPRVWSTEACDHDPGDADHLRGNQVSGSTDTGIVLTGASMNVLEKNQVLDGGASGLRGIDVGFTSLSNTLHAYVASGPMQIGLRVSNSCLNIDLSRNRVIGAGTDGIQVSSAGGIFEQNHETGSGNHGMLAFDGAGTATDNLLRANKVSRSAADGIHVEDAGNVIVGNRVTRSGGVDLDYQTAPTTTVVFNNRISTVLP